MKTVIISPSGKFYGSEQTLFEFLSRTENFTVFVKYESNGLYEILKEKLPDHHKYYKFKNTRVFYILFMIRLAFNYQNVYVNEGGYSRYIAILGKIFYWKNFFIHIRLTEDTVLDRLKGMPDNVKLISTSEYIKELIYKNTSKSSLVISSPARAFNKKSSWNDDINYQLKKEIAVIGRVTSSKGIEHVSEFINYLEKREIDYLSFNFFGDIDLKDENVSNFLRLVDDLKFAKVNFRGFANNKNNIFQNSDLVLHFNAKEPLGVVFLESLNQCIPFIGFKAGGIGCISRNLELSDSMIELNDNWCRNMLETIQSINLKNYYSARELMQSKYSADNYCIRIQNLFR